MAKLGPKELERRAMREGTFKPKRAELPAEAKRPSPAPSKSTPAAEGGAPKAAEPDEVERALAFYRKHRERQKEFQRKKRAADRAKDKA